MKYMVAVTLTPPSLVGDDVGPFSHGKPENYLKPAKIAMLTSIVLTKKI